jgi:hypothetical protein
MMMGASIAFLGGFRQRDETIRRGRQACLPRLQWIGSHVPTRTQRRRAECRGDCFGISNSPALCELTNKVQAGRTLGLPSVRSRQAEDLVRSLAARHRLATPPRCSFARSPCLAKGRAEQAAAVRPSYLVGLQERREAGSEPSLSLASAGRIPDRSLGRMRAPEPCCLAARYGSAPSIRISSARSAGARAWTAAARADRPAPCESWSSRFSV